MKTLSDYTINCTEEQTKKALELGAPIEKIRISQRDSSRPVYYTENPYENWECDAYYRPTAEQIIGWLENKSLQLIIQFRGKLWYYSIMSGYNVITISDNVKSRKEATIAAIDTALEYLINNKNNTNI